MKDRDSYSDNNPLELRRRAEQVAAEDSRIISDVSALSVEEIERMIHELHVHQIELEMQNDALRQTELALRQSEERLRLSLEATQIGIWDWDVKNDQWYAYPTYYTMLGYEPKTGLGDRCEWLERVHPDDRAGVNEQIENVLAGDFKEYQCEARLRHADGTYRWQHVKGVSVKRDEDGKVTRILGIRIDITDRKRAEEELRKSEAKYRFMIDSAPIGVLVSDVKGKILDVNRKLLQILGSPSAQATKAINILTFSPLVEAGLSAALRRCLEDEMTVTEELPYTSKWGKRLYLRMLLTPTRDLRGKVSGCLAAMEDVTERKSAEEALRESEKRLELAVQGADLGLWDFDLKSGKAVVNEEAARMAGYEPAEFAPSLSLFEQLCHPEDKERVLLALSAHTKGEFPVLDEEFRLRTKSGQWKWIHVRGKVVEHDEQGNAVRLAGTILDITKRKRSELALRRLATAVEQAEEAIAITDSAGTIQYVNPAFEKITGYSRDEALGQNPRILKSGEHDQEFYSNLWRTITGGKVWKGRFVNRRRDGTFYREDASISPVRDRSGAIVNFVAVKRDVTQELSLQEQLLQAQKMEAVGTLAGGIAHDFNNLLTVVMGFSELLMAAKDQDHPEYGDLRKILQAAKSGADLVQRLLMFSRALEPKRLPMNLNKQILQIEKLLRRTIPKMIDIRLDLASDLPDINADASQMEQVLLNLAVNARDAMPDGGRFTVRTDIACLDEEYSKLYVDVEPGQYVALEVSDTGHGMDRETLERVFEPFFTTKEMGRGTGLGLAMVYGIVKQHNGHVTVSSQVGKGTTFRVYLPVMPADMEPEVEDSSEMQAFGTETILLVDDEEFVRELGVRILTRQGYTVLQAVNGAEALELFKRESRQISMVILDLIMPEMGGTECLKELLKIDARVRILVASGYSADASVRRAVQMGAKGFVTKPFRVKELLRNVRRVLDED